MFISRARRDRDRWLLLKLATFGLGAALAVTGFALRNDLLVTVAIAVLALGILLRLLAPRDRRES